MAHIHKHRTNSPELVASEFVLQPDLNSEQQVSLFGHVLASESQASQVADSPHATVSDIMNMPGSYSAIVQKTNELQLVSDAAGQFSFYYHADGERVRYSTSAKAVAGATDNQTDRLGIGSKLLQLEDILPTLTPFASVKRVPPGSSVLFSTQGHHTTEEYEPFAPNPDTSYEEAVFQLRESLIEAVKLRLEHYDRVGSDFSGGFDSTSLGFIAARQLQPDEHFKVFHYKHELDSAGDAQHATRFATLDPRLELHNISVGADALLFDNLNPANIYQGDLPTSLFAGSRIALTIARKMSQAGVVNQLSGQGGDALLFKDSSHIPDLIRTSPLLHSCRIMQAILHSAPRQKKSPWSYLQDCRLQAAMSPQESLLQLGQMLSQGQSRADPLAWHTMMQQSLPLLTSRLRHEIGDLISESAAHFQLPPSMCLADFKARQELRGSAHSLISNREVNSLFGIDIHAPFLDRRVAAACLQLARHRHGNLHDYKPLLRDAMQGIVPQEVFARTTKGNYVNQVYQGLIKHGYRVGQLLGKESMMAQLDIIEPNEVQKAIVEMRLGRLAPFFTIVAAASTELWLRDVHDYGKQSDPGINPPAATVRATTKDPTLKPTCTTPLNVSEQLQVPDNVRLLQDPAALVAYNLSTSKHLALSPKDAILLTALQNKGRIQDAVGALMQQYPDIDTQVAEQEIASVLVLLKEHGIVQPGEHRPFTIPHTQASDKSAELTMVRPPLNKANIRIKDYARMGRALWSAFQLADPKNSMYEVLGILQNRKQDLPYSTAERAHTLMTTAHVLNRYIGKAACVEMTIATVLAEARAGRRVDIAIGAGLQPRQFHAWPVVRDEAIQTPYDLGVEGKFTAFGVW